MFISLKFIVPIDLLNTFGLQLDNIWQHVYFKKLLTVYMI
jgi:hypothetical protein